jgi:hypothetical protein
MLRPTPSWKDWYVDSTMIGNNGRVLTHITQAIDQRSVCYCYGGTCTPGCYGKKVEKRVCYCYGGFCTPGC